jgi:hypothetical protein
MIALGFGPAGGHAHLTAGYAAGELVLQPYQAVVLDLKAK